jgi:hypothetical protein
MADDYKWRNSDDYHPQSPIDDLYPSEEISIKASQTEYYLRMVDGDPRLVSVRPLLNDDKNFIPYFVLWQEDNMPPTMLPEEVALGLISSQNFVHLRTVFNGKEKYNN